MSRAATAARVGRAALTETTAPTGHKDLRLVDSPVFVLSSIRSGSTLLRVILNSHSKICAPHELHMRTVKIELGKNVEAAMKASGFTARDLENLLWDRMLDLELGRSGKSIIVDKTPANTLSWERLHRTWPHARYIVLLRHPVRVLESMVAAWPDTPMESNYAQLNRYADRLIAARDQVGGFTVKYEDLTSRPEQVTRDLCTWLDVPWEAGMLDYLEHDHGEFAARLGDWHDQIKSGKIRAAPADPALEDIPVELRDAARNLGYL